MTSFVRRLAPALPLVAALCIAPVAHAQQNDAVSCAVDSYDGTAFTAVYDAAMAMSNELCKAWIAEGGSDDAYVSLRLRQFLATSLEALNAKQLWQSGDYRPAFTDLQNAMGNISVNSLILPEFTVQRPSDLGGSRLPQGLFSPLDGSNARFDINEHAVCAAAMPGSNCTQVFEDFSEAFNPYRSVFVKRFDNAAALAALSTGWDEFLDISKSQTALEVFLTTQANRRHFRANYLVGPPPFQIIALHPDLAYNHLDAAPDGSKGKFGLSVEWIGVNFWNAKVPVGVSLASVYADRAGVRDVGHGLQLHLYNRYAIGWADHDGENSFYFNVDLLKLFEDRKARYEAYLDRYF